MRWKEGICRKCVPNAQQMVCVNRQTYCKTSRPLLCAYNVHTHPRTLTNIYWLGCYEKLGGKCVIRTTYLLWSEIRNSFLTLYSNSFITKSTSWVCRVSPILKQTMLQCRQSLALYRGEWLVSRCSRFTRYPFDRRLETVTMRKTVCFPWIEPRSFIP
jgi:hypothetical protein